MRGRATTLLVVGVVGSLVFGSGLNLARRYVPEWQPLGIYRANFYAERFASVASEVGFSGSYGSPRIELLAWPRDHEATYRLLGNKAADWIIEERRAAVIEVEGLVARRTPGDEQLEGQLIVDFTIDGRVIGVMWQERGSWVPVIPGEQLDLSPFVGVLAKQGEELEPAKEGGTIGSPSIALKVRASSPPEYIFAEATSGVVSAFRSVGSDREIMGDLNVLSTFFRLALPFVLLFVAMCVVGFQVAFILRRAVWRVPLLVAIVSLVLALVELAGREPPLWPLATYLLSSLFFAASIFLLWCGSLSLLAAQGDRRIFRGAEREGIASRAGHSLLGGFSIGLLFAGSWLLLNALAVTAANFWPTEYSIALQDPLLAVSPFRISVWRLGLALLAVAIAFPLGWKAPGAVLVATVFWSLFEFWGPWYVGPLVLSFFAAMIVLALLEFGLVGGLATSLVGVFAPLGVFALINRPWLTVELVMSAVVVGVILSAGIIGSFLKRQSAVRPPTLPSVFISYSSHDSGFVGDLAKDLKERGLHVWHFEERLRAGDPISVIISAALSEADAVLVVVSQAAIQSKWVEREWQAGRKKAIDGSGRLILLKREEGVPIPILDSDNVYVDFTNPEAYRESLRKLESALVPDETPGSPAPGANQ